MGGNKLSLMCPLCLSWPGQQGAFVMWYFSWILGVGLAVTFGILNGMWFEFKSEDDPDFEDPFKD